MKIARVVVDRPRPGAYLAIFTTGFVILELALQVIPKIDAGSIRLPVLILVVTVIVTLVYWLREPASNPPPRSIAIFLLAYLILWLYLTTLLAWRAESGALTILVVPLVVALLWFRPPNRATAVWVADWLAAALVGAILLSLIAEMVGVVDSWYGDARELIVQERTYYWMPLAGPLGLDGRWAGPFGHPNLAGPVGVFLVVFGVTRPRWRAIPFCVGGLLALVLAASRTSFIACAAGVLTLGAIWWMKRSGAPSKAVRLTLLAVPLLAISAGLIVANPRLSGRTDVWPVMAALWREDPAFGIGDVGFDNAIQSGELPVWAYHGHNVIFDATVRTGLVGLVLVLLVLVAAVVICVGGMSRERGVGLALLIALLSGSLADTILGWRYFSVPMAVLILAVLMSADEAPEIPDGRGARPAGWPP